ncbi:terpene synthase family protein [Burkholderia pseudomallei]|uniref:terpene synthase family protein n=1 Tax=Burkholderia pseudomallei TaxID=28450 RepID=UPI002279DD41|nr:terpene cyclase [Burkholderia pseudomallei]
MDAARSNAASPHARRRRPPCPPRPRLRRCRRLVGSSARRLVGEACRIASLERSFERRFDPHRRALHAHCVRWIGEQSLAPAGSPPADLRALRYPDLVAGYYVGAPPAVLEAIAGLSVWFFVWDDRHDEDARRLRRAAWARLRDALCAVLASPRARVADAEPIVGALSDCIVLRIRAWLSDAWNRRFTGHLRQVIDAYDDEFRARLAAHIPTRDAYMRLRERTFGCEVWLDCLELAAGRALPDAVRAAPPYRLAGPARRSNSPRFTTISVRCARSAKPKKSTISAFR